MCVSRLAIGPPPSCFGLCCFARRDCEPLEAAARVAIRGVRHAVSQGMSLTRSSFEIERDQLLNLGIARCTATDVVKQGGRIDMRGDIAARRFAYVDVRDVVVQHALPRRHAALAPEAALRLGDEVHPQGDALWIPGQRPRVRVAEYVRYQVLRHQRATRSSDNRLSGAMNACDERSIVELGDQQRADSHDPLRNPIPFGRHAKCVGHTSLRLLTFSRLTCSGSIHQEPASSAALRWR